MIMINNDYDCLEDDDCDYDCLEDDDSQSAKRVKNEKKLKCKFLKKGSLPDFQILRSDS